MIINIDPNAKGLIFDLDGTISDTMPIHFVAWRNAAARYGIDFTVELFDQLAGIPLYPTVEKLNELFGTKIDPQEMGDAKEAEYEANMHLAQPIEPVVDIIKKYHGQLPMAVGTGGLKRLAKKSLELIGLDQYFDIIVAYEDVNNYKPHPETFLRCAEQMGVEPAACQVFEDGVLGMQAARTAGMMVTDVTKYYEVTTGK
ncbi:HAD family phosphatase [Mangrovibacterium marinum]|uniref:HAD superfamily hydrolase (TIGR01509 family)/beta-phosphoglucomutase family hydrolase n=1 Tax=Mangrovibacterium marinum TaxID=1639118 RepID=A0A2T5C589_9BACT|nr:beta-phosphoglucomutase family hydrolase [Mangrovibacterium marinum]PTN10076.1 HAD superfamily hydrolase (TIGR01509 family)/beta-phosphoglucomutase family hydrolase [Mangrovibacterium marinum]